MIKNIFKIILKLQYHWNGGWFKNIFETTVANCGSKENYKTIVTECSFKDIYENFETTVINDGFLH